jgi:hypothetical protein
MREYATNRGLPQQDTTELQRSLRELGRLRSIRNSPGGNTAEVNSQIRQLERRCEEIISHR